jgi:RecA/RadA recombinase
MGKKKTVFDRITDVAKKNNQLAFRLSEGDNPYDVQAWTDTGCYVLNSVLYDGDIHKGLPDGKRIMISGESSTAKSLFTAFIIGKYIQSHENAYAIFFETEGATVTNMAKTVNIPEDRMIVIPVTTVEELNHQMMAIMDKITEHREEGSNDKFIFCIDSLGMLGTTKETEDIRKGTGKKDFTRAQLIKAFARVTSLKLSVLGTPLIVVNHVYSTMDMYNPHETSGGSGAKYMSDVHLMLFKTKEREGKDQVGVKIRLKVHKSRFMIEGNQVRIILHFKKGLYKYSDLVDIAYESGVLKKHKLSFLFPDGSTCAMKTVRQNPSKYLTPDVLDRINEKIKDEFGFGKLEQESGSEAFEADMKAEIAADMDDEIEFDEEEFAFEVEADDGEKEFEAENDEENPDSETD